MGKNFELIAVRPEAHATLKRMAGAQGKRIIDIASDILGQTGSLFPAAGNAAPPNSFEVNHQVFDCWAAWNKANRFKGFDPAIADAFLEGAKSLAAILRHDDLDLDAIDLEALFKKPAAQLRDAKPRPKTKRSKKRA